MGDIKIAFNQIWALIPLACAIWVIYDVLAKRKKMKSSHKALWIIGVLLFSVIIAIVYYFVVVKKK